MIKKYIYSKIHPSHLLLSFFLFVLPIIGASQNLTSKVVGKISDENGNPLVGVTVLVVGTNLGTATNGKGKFELESVSDTATLVAGHQPPNEVAAVKVVLAAIHI